MTDLERVYIVISNSRDEHIHGVFTDRADAEERASGLMHPTITEALVRRPAAETVMTSRPGDDLLKQIYQRSMTCRRDSL